MPLIPREFFSSVQNGSRARKLILPAGIVFTALLLASGLYFYSQKTRQGSAPSEVASAQNQRNLPAEWVSKYFLTEDENAPHVGGASGDPDGDILTNIQEYMYGTNPTKDDTDGDGDIDSYEIAFGQNPNGEGRLVLSNQAKRHFTDLIEGSEEYSEFSRANLSAQIHKLLKTDQTPVVLDLPNDSELILSRPNDPAAFKKYFEETVDLMAADTADYQNVQARLFDGMSDEEIDFYIQKLEAVEKILKQTPVPSQIVNIHKYKIAAIRSGIRMFELVRDQYDPEIAGSQFWADLFSYMVAAKTADSLEIAAWNELGAYLKDTGGFEELENEK